MRALLILIVLQLAHLHATEATSCETDLGGAAPPTPLTLYHEEAPLLDRDATPLDPDSLRRLGAVLRAYPYYGRHPRERLKLWLFDVGITETVDVVTPLTTVRLGARFGRDDEQFKIRVELPFVRLERRAAVAQAITDLFNQYDLLRRPLTLTREMTMLRNELTRLEASGFPPLIPVTFVRSAIKLLDEALDQRVPLSGRSRFLGRRFAAYFRARQMLVHAWLEIDVGARRRLARELLARYQPRAPHGPAPGELLTDGAIDQAVRGAERFGRPWFMTIDRPAFNATMLWFEILANRGDRVADGGLFLSRRFPGDFGEAELTRLDQRAPAEPATADPDDDKTGSSLRNTADEGQATGVDPAQPATGLPTPGGGGDVGIGGIDPSDSGPPR